MRNDAQGLPGVVGESAAMREVIGDVRRYAGSVAPVYVYGETGTGKEQIARALHALSLRARGPFVAVNAAAVSDEIFDSELFGHVRGAFTGALSNRDGYVAAAEGGTLFIDEVADLSPRAQIKLLRFLQDKEYRRVGDNQVRRADVRIVAATNVSLESRVAAGTFREDLLFRLNTLCLKLPTLRERPDDIIPLAQHLLARAAQAEGRALPDISESGRGLLEGYHWPGNVRELQSEMHRAVVVAGGPMVRGRDLSPKLVATPASEATSLARARERFERDYLARILSECRGQRTRAAQRLGITRQGLGQMMKRLGLGKREEEASEAQ